MGLNLGPSYGAGGYADALKDIIAQREMARRTAIMEQESQQRGAQDQRVAQQQQIQNELLARNVEMQDAQSQSGRPMADYGMNEIEGPQGGPAQFSSVPPQFNAVTGQTEPPLEASNRLAARPVRGVPSLGIQPTTFRPASAEQQRASSYQGALDKEMNSGVTLSPGQSRFFGGREIGNVPAAEKQDTRSLEARYAEAMANGDQAGANQWLGAMRSQRDASTRPPAANSGTTEAQTIQAAAQNFVGNPRDLTALKTISTMRGEQRLLLYNEIKRIAPNFPIGMIDRQIKFIDGYEDPKGRAALNRAAMNNILQHTADLSDANKGYQRSGLKVANIPLNKLASQYSEAWQRYQMPLNALIGEVELYFAGGYAPYGSDKSRWQEVISGNSTPAQVEQFAKDLVHVGLRRADTDNEKFRTMMGYDDPNLITPQAKAAAERLGLGSEVAKYGSGGQLGVKVKPGTAPSPDEGGTTWTRDANGNLVRK
jgi:hypothetical protein